MLTSWLQRLFWVSLLLGVGQAWAGQEMSSPVGYWLQISDNGKSAKSIVHIYPGADNTLGGQLVTGFLKPDGKPYPQNCNDCPKPFGNKKILGMHIMWGYKKDGASWDGHVLDPLKGSSYRSVITLKKDGKVLNVRGYILLPLFGRSQNWHRLTKAQAVQMSFGKQAYNTLLSRS